MTVDRSRVEESLRNLDGERSLRHLLVRELGYEAEGGLISTDDWRDDVLGVLAEDPELVATAGKEGRFTVIRVRLAQAGKLSLVAERKIIERLRNLYPYSLYVFSDAEQKLWHLVNVPHGERVANKQYRRMVIGPGEGLRTATDRISMLSVDDLADRLNKEPEEIMSLEVQVAHDEAFDVESVTGEFFREYRRVFEEVESSVVGFDNEEKRRFFVQRLFNRLMFVAFVEKKGWMRLDGRDDYLAALWDAYARSGSRDGFYRSRVKPLFFEGFNAENDPDHEDPVIGIVPYLNGGLFEEDETDKDGSIDVPDGCLREVLIGLFGRFNFTTTESTPLDTEVAVDPEMLGRVFEELVTDRHDVGAYYTPKSIVSFMCREALKGHLEKELGASEDAEREAIRVFAETHDPGGLPDPEKTLEALRSVRVCDPACGSGAYLLGMLRELLDLRESLFAARQIDPRTTYQRKLEIIQNNLYGVDTAAFAVNIARLRLWLSLVVDYEGERPPPLPNLEFKIEAGDSLASPDPSGGLQLDFFRQGQISELFELKSAFLKAHGEEKVELRGRIEDLRRKISGYVHPGGDVSGFDWQVEFAEAFGEGGFDVVVANPPYVRMELFKEIKPVLRKNFPEVHSDRADLYVYFYGRALQILKSGGMLAFISSNKWFRAGYGKKLRRLFADTCRVTSIIDFGDLPVFQDATAYAMIFVAQKGRRAASGTTFLRVSSLDPPYPDVATLVHKQGNRLPDDALDGSDWSLADAATSTRLRRMRASGAPLGEYIRGQVYAGIKTGLNRAFWIDGAQREELLADAPQAARIIKPLVVGKDIRKWHVEHQDKWLLYMTRGVDVKDLGPVLDYLRPYREDLEKRPTKQRWYELQQPQQRYAAAYDQPKIVFPDISKLDFSHYAA